MSLLHRHHIETLAEPAAIKPVPRTRLGAARVAVGTAAVIVIGLIVLFLGQNTRSFLSTDATTSLAVALLIAAVGGILLTLRRLARRHRH
jgi:uncharacterized integral membrane protein